MACQQMERDLEDSVCGVLHIKDRATINVHGSDGQGTVKLRFKVKDFEIAEKQTKERFFDGTAGGCYDSFMRSVESALEELTGEIEPARGSLSIVEEKIEDIVKTEFSKLEHEVEACEHEVEDAIHGIFGNAAEKPVTISQPEASVIQAAIKTRHPQSSAGAYNTPVGLADEPANVNLNGIDPIVLPIPVFIVESPNPVPLKDFPNFDSEGFWESQAAYANRMRYSVSTLRKYRETNSGVAWSECGTLGKDKHGNIFRKKNGKPNSSFLYFVRDDVSDRK